MSPCYAGANASSCQRQRTDRAHPHQDTGIATRPIPRKTPRPLDTVPPSVLLRGSPLPGTTQKGRNVLPPRK